MRVSSAILLLAGLMCPLLAEENLSVVARQYLDHPDFRWKCDRTAHFNICVESDFAHDRSIVALKRNAERDRARVLEIAGVTDYEHVVNVFLLRSRSRMKDLIGFDGDGRSRPMQHTVFSVVTPYRVHLTHELAHEILTNMWGAAETWIEEGVATYATEALTVDQHCWHWLSAGQLLPLAKLVNPEWKSYNYSPDVTYPQLGGFIKFLRENYGLERVKQVWQGGSASIDTVYGKTLSHLEEEWLDTLRQETRKRTPPSAD